MLAMRNEARMSRHGEIGVQGLSVEYWSSSPPIASYGLSPGFDGAIGVDAIRTAAVGDVLFGLWQLPQLVL